MISFDGIGRFIGFIGFVGLVEFSGSVKENSSSLGVGHCGLSSPQTLIRTDPGEGERKANKPSERGISWGRGEKVFAPPSGRLIIV